MKVVSQAATRCFKSDPFKASVVVVAGIVLGLLLFEGLLRLKYHNSFAYYESWGHKKSILFGFEAKPSHRWKAGGAIYSTDAFGFRSHPDQVEWNKAGLYKIFVLGGSSTFGFHLNNHETWPVLLERALKRGSDGTATPVVVNAANSGHNSIQCWLRFYLKVLPLKPDQVIYYEAINDVRPERLQSDSVFITESILFSKSVAEYLAKDRQHEPFYRRTLICYFFERVASKLRRLFPKKANAEELVVPRTLTAEEQSVIHANGERFIQNVTGIARLCQERRILLTLVTFMHDTEHMDFSVTFALHHYNRLLRRLASKEKGVRLVDLEHAFQRVAGKKEYFFEDHYHPNLKGAAWMAEEILQRAPWLHGNGTNP